MRFEVAREALAVTERAGRTVPGSRRRAARRIGGQRGDGFDVAGFCARTPAHPSPPGAAGSHRRVARRSADQRQLPANAHPQRLAGGGVGIARSVSRETSAQEAARGAAQRQRREAQVLGACRGKLPRWRRAATAHVGIPFQQPQHRLRIRRSSSHQREYGLRRSETTGGSRTARWRRRAGCGSTATWRQAARAGRRYW